jgi:toxin ParE1/3/4
MARHVIFNRLATKEFRDAREWYGLRSQIASANFVLAVDAAVQRIIVDYESLSTVEKNFRRVPVEKYPYNLIFYPRTESEFRVVAVAHAKRRPEYWKRRR